MRRREIERPATPKRELAPTLVVAFPIKRMRDTASLQPIPSLGQPKARVVIPAIHDELQIFPVADQPGSQTVGVEIMVVARRFIIEAE